MSSEGSASPPTQGVGGAEMRAAAMQGAPVHTGTATRTTPPSAARCRRRCARAYRDAGCALRPGAPCIPHPGMHGVRPCIPCIPGVRPMHTEMRFCRCVPAYGGGCCAARGAGDDDAPCTWRAMMHGRIRVVALTRTPGTRMTDAGRPWGSAL